MGSHPFLSKTLARLSLCFTVGCSLGDFFTDVLYVAVHPYASFQLWVAACAVLVLPALVFSLGSGLLGQIIGRGIPRMIVAATRFVPKERRALDNEVCPLLCPRHMTCCLVRGACLPVSAVVAVLFLVLIKPVLCLVLLFLAVNLKLVVFPRLMSRLIDFVLHELPEEEASVQTAPFGITPNSSTQVKYISSTSSSIDETEDVFRLNLAFLSAMVFGSMPQLGITIANTFYLGQSSAASGFPEAASGVPVLALVSMFFSVLVIVLHGGRMAYWASRYGWRMDLRMIMYPLRDTHLHRLQLIRNLYKASNSLTSAVWAPDSGRERDKRISAAAERTSRTERTSRASKASASFNGSGSEPSSSSGPRTYMAAVTMKHDTTKPGWLSLEVGQVVNVLFENPSADEVFVKVLVDGRQGSFPMRCVTLNDDKGSENRKAESLERSSTMPVGMPPEIELQPSPSRSNSSTKLVTGRKTVSSAEVAFNVDGEKSQLQLHRAAELQKTRAELQKTRAAAAAASTSRKSVSEIRRSQVDKSTSEIKRGDLKYKERLTRARSTTSCAPCGRGGKPAEENSEMAADLAKTAALVESALRMTEGGHMPSRSAQKP